MIVNIKRSTKGEPALNIKRGTMLTKKRHARAFGEKLLKQFAQRERQEVVRSEMSKAERNDEEE